MELEQGEIYEDGVPSPVSSYHPSMEWPGVDSDEDTLRDSSLSHGSPSNTPGRPGTPSSYDLFTEPSGSSSSKLSRALTNATHLSVPSVPSSIVKHTLSTSLRLLVSRSSILLRHQTLAILDGYPEIQIGRDAPPAGTATPRIRLKEMEISKIHATIYWDESRSEWSVVDMGSKHGTFIRSSLVQSVSGSGVSHEDPRGFRLSPPRMASIPRSLSHGDELSVGGTTFRVHIHEDGIPCAECSPKGGEEIALFDKRRAEKETANKRKRKEVESSSASMSPVERDPKRAMTMLKRSLLSRRDSSPITSPPDASSPTYVDRSARRRALHPSTPPDSPGISVTSGPVVLKEHRQAPSPLPSPPDPVSAPPTPLSSSSIGHRLLMKQGWQPGETLGASDTSSDSDSIALAEPLDITGNRNRTGLGMRSAAPPDPSNNSLSWQEQGKQRRWEGLRAVVRSS